MTCAAAACTVRIKPRDACRARKVGIVKDSLRATSPSRDISAACNYHVNIDRRKQIVDLSQVLRAQNHSRKER